MSSYVGQINKAQNANLKIAFINGGIGFVSNNHYATLFQLSTECSILYFIKYKVFLIAVDNELFKEMDSSYSRMQKESLKIWKKGNSVFSAVLMSLIIQDIIACFLIGIHCVKKKLSIQTPWTICVPWHAKTLSQLNPICLVDLPLFVWFTYKNSTKMVFLPKNNAQ